MLSDAGRMSWGDHAAERHDSGRIASYYPRRDCPGLFKSIVSPVAQQDHHELHASVCMHVLSMSLTFRGSGGTRAAMNGLTRPPRTGRVGEGSAPGLPGAQPLRQQLRWPRRPIPVVGPVAGGLPEPVRALLPGGLLRVALLLLRPQRLCRVRPSPTLCGVLMAPCWYSTHAQMPWLPASRLCRDQAEPCGRPLEHFVNGMSKTQKHLRKLSNSVPSWRLHGAQVAVTTICIRRFLLTHACYTEQRLATSH